MTANYTMNKYAEFQDCATWYLVDLAISLTQGAGNAASRNMLATSSATLASSCQCPYELE
eukprot:15632-Pleurochrysis_carterae.AAC.5